MAEETRVSEIQQAKDLLVQLAGGKVNAFNFAKKAEPILRNLASLATAMDKAIFEKDTQLDEYRGVVEGQNVELANVKCQLQTCHSILGNIQEMTKDFEYLG